MLSSKSKDIMREPALINPAEQEDWNNLLISTPGYSFFHTSNWAEVLRKSYSYTACLPVCQGTKPVCKFAARDGS